MDFFILFLVIRRPPRSPRTAPLFPVTPLFRSIDAAALCLKAGNAAILRGGSEAFHSNMALGDVIQNSLAGAGLPTHAVQVVATTDRAAVGRMATMTDYIDVIVPRGGKGLITRPAAAATVPLITHLGGNCPRPEETTVRKECVSTCQTRGAPI